MTAFGRRAGDMNKSDYDSDGDGVVDNSELLEGKSKSEVQDHTPKSHTHAESEVTDLVDDLAGKSAVGHTHTESEVTDLDHDALKVKGVDVDDSAKADQKVLAFVSASGNIEYITQAPSGAALNSIQHGIVTIPWDEASATAAIISVDTSKSVCFHLGNEGVDLNYYSGLLAVCLTNATTITASRHASADVGKVSFIVLEFSSGVDSIQSGIITLSDLTNTFTITCVDLSKSLLVFRGVTFDSAGTNLREVNVYIALTDSTTVTVSRRNNAGTCYVSFSVLEFL
ncbi:hypothetical protein ES702_05039 [subsurface metagenome]